MESQSLDECLAFSENVSLMSAYDLYGSMEVGT